MSESFERLLLSSVLLALCAGCSSGPGVETPATPARHVVLISLDTTRADQFGFYGNRAAQTPSLDALAAESIVLDDYMTVAPTTLASHASIFTGTHPQRHGVPRNGFVLHGDNRMMAEILAEQGFTTAGFAASFALASRFGISEGFDHYDETWERESGDGGRFQHERPAEGVTDSVLAWLEESGVPERLFLFVHYFDPHSPYEAPAPYDTIFDKQGRSGLPSWFDVINECKDKGGRSAAVKRMAQQYGGEIAYMDHHIGRLLDGLRARGILDEALLVVTSDHGENFWDHPMCFDHGWTTYQSTMQAVGVLRPPGGRAEGERVTGPLSTIDILPTVLRATGVAAPDSLDGVALNLDKPTAIDPARVRFAQASKPWKEVETDPRWYNQNKARFIRDGKYKFIQVPFSGLEELYDVEADRLERVNLLEGTPDEAITRRAAEMRARLEEWADSADPLPSKFEDESREETIRRLRDLGYLGN